MNMTWIERHLAVLRVTCAFAVISASVVVLWVFFKTREQAIEISRMQLGLGILPWMVGFGAFLPLTYHSWSKVGPRVPRTFLQVFFWLFSLSVVFMFFQMYRLFVFAR